MTEPTSEQLKLALDLVKALGESGIAKLRGVMSDSGEGVRVEGRGTGQPVGLPVGGVGVVPDEEHSDGTSVSTMSWADMVDAEVSLSGVPSASSDVKSKVVFGGFGAKVGGQVEPVAGPEGGLMQQFVRTDSAKGLRKKLAEVGIKMPKDSAYLLALCTHTAATMPYFFKAGKDKLKTLAVLGDSALVAAVAAQALLVGDTVDSVQHLRVTRLTDATMARVFAKSRFASCISLAAGVDLKHTKTGATALEAIVGLVAYYRSPSDVLELAKCFGFV